MAKPIEPTPTLKGEDAKRFFDSIEKAKYDPRKEEAINEARRVYNDVKGRWTPYPSHISTTEDK